jgi:hypothetical protein
MGLFGPDSVPPNQLQVEKAKGIVAYQMENDNICRKPLNSVTALRQNKMKFSGYRNG